MTLITVSFRSFPDAFSLNVPFFEFPYVNIVIVFPNILSPSLEFTSHILTFVYISIWKLLIPLTFLNSFDKITVKSTIFSYQFPFTFIETIFPWSFIFLVWRRIDHYSETIFWISTKLSFINVMPNLKFNAFSFSLQDATSVSTISNI